MRRYLCLILLATANVLAATSEEQARGVLDQLKSASDAKDIDAVSRLLAKDCVVVMTEPTAGAKSVRFFTRDSYLKLLKERYSAVAATTHKDTTHAVSASETGDVFIVGESDVRARVEQRSELYHYSTYMVMHPVDGKMLIRFVVSQLAFYFPDVPSAPEPQPSSTPKA
jgi:ketosteroid isomerase-like protein